MPPSAVSRPRIPLLIAALALIPIALFTLWPEFDLQVSSYFYDEATARFPLYENKILRFASKISVPVILLFIMTATVLAVYGILRKHTVLGLTKARYIYLMVLLLVAPLITVLVFKNTWSRARPMEVVQFGGEVAFTPYYEPTDQCAEDCSFISGHTSRGFYFLGVVFLLQAWQSRWRRPVQLLLGAYAVQAGVLRVITGQHWSTDVLFAAIIVTTIAWQFYRLLRRYEQRNPQSH